VQTPISGRKGYFFAEEQEFNEEENIPINPIATKYMIFIFFIISG
jgi:hypothetical protein